MTKLREWKAEHIEVGGACQRHGAGVGMGLAPTSRWAPRHAHVAVHKALLPSVGSIPEGR